MMKNYITLLFILSILSLNAQTITSDWFHKPGDAYAMEQGSTGNFEIPTTGLDQNWDFSNAVASGPWVYTWVDPSVMTTFDEFPDATVARYGVSGNDTSLEEIFYQVTKDTVFYLGVNILATPGVPIIKIRTVPDQVAVFPLEYGDSFENDIESLLVITIIGSLADTMVTPAEISVTTFAGIGDVVTPNGTFEDCIMLTDSIAGQSAPHIFRFYKNSFSNQIAEYSNGTDPTTGEFVQSLQYRDTTALISSLDETLEESFPLTFLGKINNALQINSQDKFNANCQLINAEGKLIQTWDKEFNSGDNFLEMNNYKSSLGFYVIFIYNKDTGAFKSFKFIE